MLVNFLLKERRFGDSSLYFFDIIDNKFIFDTLFSKSFELCGG